MLISSDPCSQMLPTAQKWDQDCERSAKAHQIKNCTHWKNVQRQKWKG